MSKFRKMNLTVSEVRMTLMILRAFKDGLLTYDDNDDEAWDLDKYGERLVNSKGVGGVIRKLEASLPKEEAKEIEKAVLLRRYSTFRNEVDERVYSSLSKAFENKRRIEIDYFSMERAEATRRSIDIYYLNRRYVIAFDHLRNAMRKFRTSRVMKIRKIGNDVYTIPADFDKKAYL
ncbi:MAG: WYL domain-containing protein [Thaumarchaeota archaeon]|nr:WYL domain-containing protein [Nitrososphaerota archaeon]